MKNYKLVVEKSKIYTDGDYGFYNYKAFGGKQVIKINKDAHEVKINKYELIEDEWFVKYEFTDLVKIIMATRSKYEDLTNYAISVYKSIEKKPLKDLKFDFEFGGNQEGKIHFYIEEIK